MERSACSIKTCLVNNAEAHLTFNMRCKIQVRSDLSNVCQVWLSLSLSLSAFFSWSGLALLLLLAPLLFPPLAFLPPRTSSFQLLSLHPSFAFPVLPILRGPSSSLPRLFLHHPLYLHLLILRLPPFSSFFVLLRCSSSFLFLLRPSSSFLLRLRPSSSARKLWFFVLTCAAPCNKSKRRARRCEAAPFLCMGIIVSNQFKSVSGI